MQVCYVPNLVSPIVTQHVVSVEFSSLLFHSINRDLFVYRDDSLTSYRVIMRTEQPTTSETEGEVRPVKLVKYPTSNLLLTVPWR